MTDLEIDASITVYTFKGGVEQRRPWKPMARLTASILSLGDQFAELTTAPRGMADSLTGAFKPLR